LLVVVTLAFAPLLFVSSSITMDYMPALALLLWSYRHLLHGRYALSALLIGLASGFRPTSLLFAVPCAVYVRQKTGRWAQVVRLGFVAGLTAIVAYLPVLLSYGMRRSSISLGAVPHVLVFAYRLLEVFGVVQSAVLGPLLLVLLWRNRHGVRQDATTTFHLVNGLVWVLLFTVFPYEAEYLLPAMPSAIFLLDRLASRPAFVSMAALLLSYHLLRVEILGGESGRRTLRPVLARGYTLWDVEDRRFKLSTRRAETEFRTERPTVLMYGEDWIPSANPEWFLDPDVEMYRQRKGNLYVSAPITEGARLRLLTARGFRLVAWRGRKSELLAAHDGGWRDSIEMVDDLEDFFDHPLAGRPLQ
jgi:hypothetical protein